ncbi:hypothetical protein [Methanothermococcus sp.]|uniref:hypothetical protein n=1 Tax=Methanothermococcus sp. TaxID=2614238 RepID=UPI0025F2401C|nr:hypothetical protein [Methanothermococcus sp.]
MKIKAYHGVILLLIFIMGLYINTVTLNFQCDPFIPTTIIMAKSIGEFGSITEACDYISNAAKYSAWQDHTKDFIKYEPLSGIIVCIIAKMTGLNEYTVSYLPIPYIIYCIFLYLIFKILYSINTKISRNQNLNIFIFFVVLSGIYAFICKFVIGKFYVMEYHGIYWVYILAIYYLLLKYFILNNNHEIIQKIFLLIYIIFITNLFTHYNFPMTILGGLIIFITACMLLKCIGLNLLNNKIDYLKHAIPIFIILITLQNFYFLNLSHAGNFLDIFDILINTVINKITGSSSGVISSYSGYVYTTQWMFFRKWWHILFVLSAISIFITITLYYLKNKDKNVNLMSYFYTLILGRDFTWMYTYFINYGGNLSFYLPNSWFLNSLILTPITELLNSKKIFWKNTGKLFLIGAFILTLFLILDSSFEAYYAISGYSPFPYQVRNDGEQSFNFLISNIDRPEIIVGSLESSSALYAEMSKYSISKLNIIYPKPALDYMLIPGVKEHKSINEIYYSLKKGRVSKFILTKYELDKGFVGGLTVAPLTKNETKELKTILDTNENLIYDSGKAKIYDFNY